MVQAWFYRIQEVEDMRLNGNVVENGRSRSKSAPSQSPKISKKKDKKKKVEEETVDTVTSVSLR